MLRLTPHLGSWMDVTELHRLQILDWRFEAAIGAEYHSETCSPP